ncbi:MAG TPA: hypothetical protein VKX39_15675 [Bryobacteraceae bacterium]|nr:hypothetical protein [Bryobacteraceae bacterium]
MARSQGARISYAGFEEKESFIRRLINTCDVPPDIARFGLLGIAGVPRRVGANRNTILLETTGKLFFSADDDTSASTAPSPSAAPGLKFTSSHDPAEIWFHPNRDMALASTAETSIDILRANEDLLGKSLAECCAETVPINTDELPPRMLRHIRSGNGRIALTLPGIAGDSGMGSPRWLGVKGATRERLLASHEMYETAFSSRNIVRATGSCTVSSGSFFMSYAAGFDNRELLPPFIPIQRNSDGVFGLTLRKCVENGYIAHLPWSVQHCPSEGRSWSKQELWDSFSTCRVADILILCINSYDFWPGMSDATNRLRMLGNYLEDLAGLSKNEFEEFLRIRMCQQLSRMVSEIEEQLRANQSKPEYWLADVEKYIECLRFAAVKSDIFAPADLKPLYGPEKAREFMHELVGQVGRLFRLWPHLIAAARELQTKEVNLAFQPSP